MQPIEDLLRDQWRRNDKALAVSRDDMVTRVARVRRRRGRLRGDHELAFGAANRKRAAWAAVLG